MGMSAEDFGAVLAELKEPTPLADAFETRFPQADESRWWFTTRMHCAGFFVSKPVQVDGAKKLYKERVESGIPEESARRSLKKTESLLLAKNAWGKIMRPEMYLWILEALGLQEEAKELSDLLHAELDKGECDLNTLLEIAKGVFNWEKVEKAARDKHEKLVSDLLTNRSLSHRSV